MAKPTKPRASQKGAKASSKKPARKAPKKALSKPKAVKAKTAKPRPKAKKPAATRVEASAMPEHAVSKAAARRAVARPTKAHHENQEAHADHDHQDPRLAGIPGVNHEGQKVQVENYGQFKNKVVGRLDKPINWFRRSAKPKQ
ncbi:MAG: hypothetical protein WC876_11290 [Candidatus Thermoplasmatota archaeon]